MRMLTQRFKFWYLQLRQALRGDAYDYTQGSIRRAVFLLAIPMILELGMESVFAVVDMFFVGKLGENAIATVGLTESAITIIYSVAIGLSTAATAIVARRTGEKNPEAAARSAAQALLVAAAVTVVLSVSGALWASDILRLMGASAAVVQEGSLFTRIMLGSSGCIVFLFLINGIFRGAGNAAMAMKSLLLASVLNIILDPIFIAFWGLPGAAIATVLGRSAGVAYQCYHLAKGDGGLQLRRTLLKPHVAEIKHLFSIAWPATFQFIIASGSWIVLARLVAATGGTSALAGYQVALRNVIFFILPAWGLSNAAATLVGQNLGAGRPDRAIASVRITALYNALFMAGVTLLFLLAAAPIIRVFTTAPQAVAYGIQALHIIGTGFIFYGIGMVMTQALNGAGDTRTPTWINLVGFWLLQVPLAWVLALPLRWGLTGVLVAIPVAETFIALLAWYFFRKGSWEKIAV